MENNKEISLPKIGMNLDSAPHDLGEQEYTYAYGSILEDRDGNGVNLQNEPSNLLCSIFKSGYKVIGFKSDINNNLVYFFLTNPTTGSSEIGVIRNVHNLSVIEDVESQCGCSFKNILAEPLENITQTESCTYTTLIKDDCNKCLNFKIEFPIHDIVLKTEKSGDRLYWTDNNNPPRYLDLNRIDWYKYKFDAVCDEDAVLNCVENELCDCDDCEDSCPDCEKLNIFKSFNKPCLKPITLVNGGNLKRGVYQFLIAYCDERGVELSEYYSLTNPIRIFDEYDNILNQTELAKETNYAIKLEALGLDRRYTHYKIAVVQAATVSGDTAYFLEGIHSTSTNTVLYTSENDKERLTLERIKAVKPDYIKSEGMTASGGYLYQYGMTAEETINLQPIVILMSAFLRWQAVAAKENLYKDGVSDALYAGYMRGENVPFAIKFFTDKGLYTSNFIFTHRPPTEEELETVNNTDTQSILEYINDCEENARTKRWQFYNTAEIVSSTCTEYNEEDAIEFTKQTKFRCEVLVEEVVGSGTYTADIPTNYDSFKEFIEDYRTQILDPTSEYYDSTLVDILNEEYSAVTCTPEIDSQCDSLTISSTENFVDSIVEEVITVNYKDVAEYDPTAPLSICNNYLLDGNGEVQPDIEFNTEFVLDITPLPAFPIAYQRYPIGSALNCSTPRVISTAIQNTYLTFEGSNVLADLLQSTRASIASGGNFYSNLHKNAVWHKFKFNGEDKGILEIVRASPCSQDEVFSNNLIRLSTYINCTTAAVTETFIVDTTLGDFIVLDKADYGGQEEILIAVDAPIKTQTYSSLPTTRYYIEPPCGCFALVQKEVERRNTTVTWEDIILNKVMTYTADCVYYLPQVSDCEVSPYLEGKFGYWESTRNYPDNKELFDASEIKIKEADIPSNIRTEFEDYFTSGGTTDTDGNYILNDETKLYCKPIRHYKMPSNKLVPFMAETDLPDFQETVIFPLGVKIDNNIINAFLDIAKNNGLITQKQRDSIVGYEILRGDRTLDKHILSKGLIYDTAKYTDSDEKEIFYSNYPYNTLGKDCNHFNLNSGRAESDLLEFNVNQNNRYTYHSPDIHFKNPKPTLPTEIEYEGYQFGKAKGKYDQVEGHPKYVILDKRAFTTANALATAEVALETALLLGRAYLSYVESFRIEPMTGGNNIAGNLFAIGVTTAITIAQTTANGIFNLGRKRFEWLEAFKNNGKPKNFAYQYSSEGWYNSYKHLHSEGNLLRGVAAAKYLKGGGNYAIVEKKDPQTRYFNNVDRESSMYLSLGDYNIVYADDYKNWDNYNVDRLNSSRRRSGDTGKIDTELTSKIASPYISLKQYLPEQYGDINDIRWINTGYCGKLNTENLCDVIFGGDTRISRMSLKRKIPMFLVNAIDQADYTPFAYSLYNNIGEVRHWANFDIELGNSSLIASVFDSIFPDVNSEENFDTKTSVNDKNFYLTTPSKIYLFYYGIPQFLVESEINVNYRYAGREPKEWFYPNGGNPNGYDKWTQNINVPIRFDNEYRYNDLYSRNIFFDKGSLLPLTYSKESWLRKQDFKNLVIVSEADVTETNDNDPYLNYRPFNVYEFAKENGKLISLDDIESRQMIARFTNGFSLLNSIDVIRERLTPNNAYLGLGVFEQRPLEFKRTELGYGGTQHKFLISCEFGHFWVDAKRGQIMKVDSNGQSPQEISAFKRDGKPSGMRNWFKENLPFKILRGVVGLSDTDLDNNFNGLGISGVWDSRLRRVLITKRDYVVKEQFRNLIGFRSSDKKFYIISNNTVIQTSNTTYFEDASFTISYSPLYDAWSSFHAYKPDYYIGYNNYFQSGYNFPTASLWSHLLTNKSFQVFKGVKTPWLIEYPNRERFNNKVSNAVEYWLDVRRYHNEWDFASKTDLGFNKAWIYNNSGNSGQLNLINTIKNNRFQLTQYPRINGNVFEILQTPYDKKFTFNDFYNRVRNELSNVPVWINDVNNIKTSLNLKAFNFENRKTDRIRGDWNLVRLQQDAETRFKMIFKWGANKNNFYN